MKLTRLFVFILTVTVLVACGQAPDLSLPTPIAAEPTADAQPIVTSAATEPSISLTQPPAPTLPPAGATTAPTTLPSPTPDPTSPSSLATPPATTPVTVPIAATPVMTPAVWVGQGDYQVAFVEGNDTLNVRRGPGASYEAVEALLPNAAGIAVDETGQTAVAGSTWVYVTTDTAEGWVNSRFLTESMPATTFCADPAAATVVERLRQAVADLDGPALASLVHPERGLRLRLNWWNNEVVVRGDEVAGLFDSTAEVDWGMSQGSGEPIAGTFAEAFLPPLQRDLLPATQTACDEVLFGPTAGMVILPDGYQQVHFFSLHRPAPADVEFDWGTWVVGVERWQGEYYLSYLVHYNYEI